MTDAKFIISDNDIPKQRQKPEYNYYDIDLVGDLEPEWSKSMIKAIGKDGWEIIKITDAIKIGKKHFIRIFVKKIEL